MLNLVDKSTGQSSGRQVDLQMVNDLLGQKAFVKQMLSQNPKFMEHVTLEVKERVKEEIKGEGD